MANLTEISNWEPGIQQIERSDLWDAGTGGSGIANLQAKQLANRTQFLKDEVNVLLSKVNFVLDVPTITCVNGTNINLDGTAYNLTYPFTNANYTTPNDGVTRQYEITIACFADFTYGAAANIQMVLATTTPGPVFVPLITANLRQPYQTINYKKVLTLAPNTALLVFFGNNATGANANFTDCQLHVKEI